MTIGFKTIRKGKRAAVWNQDGEVQIVEGPRRLFLFGQACEPLERFSAEADEYLALRFRDGRAVHVRGPADAWLDPIEHERIEVHKALPINAHEALVIYARSDDGSVKRRIVRGPAQYVPAAHEWLHTFSWHGANPKDRRRKTPHALKFSKLWIVPDQMYFDVEEVRTADDALLTVQVMVFFELADIELMLDQTHDPVADFINALSADVIEFAASKDFDTFKRQTDLLNQLETYRNLTRRAEGIGYRINKVVYRGYVANPKLQAMHDNAIEARTSLRLEAETEAQAQQLADLKLTRERERDRLRRELELDQANHRRELQRREHEESLRQLLAEQQQQVEGKRLLNEVELEVMRSKNREQTALLQAMRTLEIDLTRYLVAQYQHPDRLLRIEGGTLDSQVQITAPAT